MSYRIKPLALSLLLALPVAQAGDAHQHGTADIAASAALEAPAPHKPQLLPPSTEQSLYQLPESSRPRTDLQLPTRSLASKQQARTCEDMNLLASYSGAALADYITKLPSYECHYGLFSLSGSQAAKVFTADNYRAITERFAQEAASYNGKTQALVNLTLYLRAGYFLANSNATVKAPADLLNSTRPVIGSLLDRGVLFQPNASAPTTAEEVMKLITNQSDSVHYLPRMKSVLARFSNSTANPQASDALKDRNAAGGLTGALTVIFYSHWGSGAEAVLTADTSYLDALYGFVRANKAALSGGSLSYQLRDAANEAFRFGRYSKMLPQVKPLIQETLSGSSMLGKDSDLWLAAAQAVERYDRANCSSYGVCDFTTQLAKAVLKTEHSCSPTIRIRAQDMTAAQLGESCSKLQQSERYFHNMLQTKQVPVANDQNSALEMVVFDDYANYNKYASVIFGISTDNGGMYLEGNPAKAGNQARFIAHEASWLRPSFQVWNLEHEYIHYLDGRFNMYGDFGVSTSQPTVWWLEGLGEYMSLKNNNQKAIDEAKKGSYSLSQIFGNSYDMADYTNRAYRWGYMATRFMFEQKRSDVDAILARFRIGDYSGYQGLIKQIGTRYDSEFANWVKSASTSGEPPMPKPEPVADLPECKQSQPYYLGKNCSIRNLAASKQHHVFVMLPKGAKNLKLWTQGGTGDVDLLVSLDRYPSTTAADYASRNSGNSESIGIASPQAGKWYYITLQAKQAFSGVSINASYE